MLDYYSSISVIAKLDDEEKKHALDKFRIVLDSYIGDDEAVSLPFFLEYYSVEKFK